MNVRHEVEKLGERIGFGHLMQIASEIWADRQRRLNLADSELTLGPCANQLVPCYCASQDRTSCDWCAGTQRVTRRVYQAMVEPSFGAAEDLICFALKIWEEKMADLLKDGGGLDVEMVRTRYHVEAYQELLEAMGKRRNAG